MLWVLDSTVLIDVLRGRPAMARLRALRQLGDTPATTAINVEEVVRGLRSGEARDAHELFLGLDVLALDSSVAWRAGAWRGAYAAHGITLSQADCLIAAATESARASLATGNPRHFPMPGLVVEHWPVGT